MAFLRLSMQHSSATSSMDSNFYRPLERNQTNVGSTSLPLRVYEKVISEPILIEYEDFQANKKAAPHWLSPNYIDLHMRSARLVSCEAKTALHRHFEQPRKSKVKIRRGGEGMMGEGERMMVGDDASWFSMLEERSFLDEPFC